MEHLFNNNSTSMKTEVETYLIEETKELIYDNEKLDQWNSLVAELELQGQTKVVKVDKSPVPFLWMNDVLQKVFTELCPRKVKIVEYDKTPIPVEVLSLIALSKKEDYFNKIEVWYNDKNPDPAVVGFRYTRGNTEWERDWHAEKYLLARWSDVKASLAELTDRAKKLFALRRTNELQTSIKQHQRELEDIELKANAEFGFANEPDVGLPF